ncbi:hypothetical protein PTTG_26257 [Puccinia triticina 1-1 BBBD Race 1]|uniref:Uncharacterized protein n=1 Tax=Puccinia triticina (isolate 1-1 / race 1 (BBBD)) TaxID=630390 RepID=A0A180GVK8_PUCT1|nr:hypothetical protein PTTG_26257 [Puccinia triticina 1-1 BBBD Race 1]
MIHQFATTTPVPRCQRHFFLSSSATFSRASPSNKNSNITNPPCALRGSLPSSQWPQLNLSSSCSLSDDGLLLGQASSSSLASVASIANSINGLKACCGLIKPLSPVPQANDHQQQQQSNVAQALATPLRERHERTNNSNMKSKTPYCAPFPSLPWLGDLGQSRAQFVGMKANLTHGLFVKRRTSIPPLLLGGIRLTETLRGHELVQLIGRNNKSVMNTPPQAALQLVCCG